MVGVLRGSANLLRVMVDLGQFQSLVSDSSGCYEAELYYDGTLEHCEL